MVRVEERPFRLCRTQHVFGSDPCCSVSAFHIIKPVYDCTLTTALPRFNIPVYKHTHKKILSDAHNMSTMSIHNAMVVLIREHTPIIIVPVKGVNSWNHWLIGFSPRAVNVFIFQVFNSTIRARRGRWWIWKRWKNVNFLEGNQPKEAKIKGEEITIQTNTMCCKSAITFYIEKTGSHVGKFAKESQQARTLPLLV